MFTIWGAKQRFCDGMTRRSFLKIGAFGTGLSLADLLRLKANAGAAAPSPHKAAIMIYMEGGPSHIDSYDLKPDAPVEFRGEFKPIPTNVPGIQICEHLPLQARMMDKLAVIRSIESVNEHSDHEIMTGFSQAVNRTAHHPLVGSVISKLRGQEKAGLPPFVSMCRGPYPPNPDSGYLGLAHRPFRPDPKGQGLQNLLLPKGITADRFEDRKSLLASFDDVRRDIDSSMVDGMDAYRMRAFDTITSGAVHRAVDLTREDPATRERYKGAEQFLTARRLVEAGVACVTLSTTNGWDTHIGNFKALRTMLPAVDRGIANLIQDLHDRGLDQDVVTVIWGEFGRTPKVNDKDGGRDHWPACMSALIAGGGLKMGQAIGASSARGEYPKDRRYKPANVLATIYRTLGIDPALTFPNGSGRPMYILDDREPVRELI